MASHTLQTPDSLSRQIFVYVMMGSVAFIIGCIAVMALIPVTG